jgi:hypothetical protein
MDGIDDDMLWNGNEGDMNVRSEEGEEDEVLTVKRETVTLIDKDRS